MSYGPYPPRQPQASNTWVFVLLGSLFGGGLLLILVCGGIGMGIVYAIDAAASQAQTAADLAEGRLDEFPAFGGSDGQAFEPAGPTAGGPSPAPFEVERPAFVDRSVDTFDEAVAALNSSDTSDDRDAIRWLGGQPVSDLHKSDVVAGLVACLQRRSAVRDALPQLVQWAGDDLDPLLLGYLLDPESIGNDSFLIEESMRILHERKNPELAAALVGIVQSGNVRSYDAKRYLKQIGADAEDAILPLMNHADAGARIVARELLADFGTSAAAMTEQAIADLGAESNVTRQEAARYLREKGAIDDNNREEMLTKLAASIEEGSGFDRGENLELFLKHAQIDREEDVLRLADSDDPQVSSACLRWLGQKSSARGLAKLGEMFTDARKRSQITAALKAAGPAAEDVILPYLDDENYTTQLEALKILETIGTDKSLEALQKKYRSAVGRGDKLFSRRVQDSMEALKIRLTLKQRAEESNAAPPTATTRPPTQTPSASGKFRVWTDATGSYTIDAEFVRRDGNTVTIRRKVDGGEVALPLDQLSAADRAYVDSLD